MTLRTLLALAGITILVPFQAAPALAHATLEVTQAPIKSSYKATIRVGHGCQGSATLKVRVRIPEGYIAVKPMPKAGWALETIRAPYPQPVKYYDETLKEGVREVIWTGKLLDEHYDEFVVRGYLSDALEPGSRLYIPVVQECETGTHRWIEIPAPGKSADDYKEPAPSVKLLPATN